MFLADAASDVDQAVNSEIDRILELYAGASGRTGSDSSG